MLMKPLLVLMLALSGCAATQWVKPGSTAQDLARADLECQKVAMSMANQQGDWGTRKFHDTCMRADGWEEK
jgi:hypothetical protein